MCTQLNVAKDAFGTPDKIPGMRARWRGQSQPRWNPSAPPSTEAAYLDLIDDLGLGTDSAG